MEYPITNQNEYTPWVKVQLALQGKTQKDLAAQLGVPATRISEAIHAKPGGKKYIIPLIQTLGGDPYYFEEFLKKVLRKPVSFPARACTTD